MGNRAAEIAADRTPPLYKKGPSPTRGERKRATRRKLKGRGERVFGRLRAASSNCLSSISLVPRRPTTTFRAQEMYSIFRRTDQSGAGLVASARKLLVLSASLRAFAFGLFLWAVSA